jgi:hypothetical protein
MILQELLNHFVENLFNTSSLDCLAPCQPGKAEGKRGCIIKKAWASKLLIRILILRAQRDLYEHYHTMQLSRRSLRTAYASIEASSCLLCQWRSFSISYRRYAEKDTPAKPPSPLDDAPRAYGKAVDHFTPKPLNRPIGLPNPPRPGENTGVDRRTLKERRDDFVDYDKHLIRRKQLYAIL